MRAQGWPDNSTEMQAGDCRYASKNLCPSLEAATQGSSRCPKIAEVDAQAHTSWTEPVGKFPCNLRKIQASQGHWRAEPCTQRVPGALSSPRASSPATNTAFEDTCGPQVEKTKTRREKTPAFQDWQWQRGAECLAEGPGVRDPLLPPTPTQRWLREPSRHGDCRPDSGLEPRPLLRDP